MASKEASQAPESEARKQKRPHTVPVHIRRKVRRPTEIVTSEGTYIPSEDDTNNLDSPDEDDVESIDLSEEESDEDEEHEDDYDDDDDDDDTESDYLSDSDEPEAIHSGAVSRTSVGTRRSISSRNPRTSVARSGNKHASQSHGTFSQTRTETTQWMVAQQRSQEASSRHIVARGGTSTRQQNIHQQSPTVETRTGQGRGISGGNSLRLNMSLSVDVQFNGFVTGRNLFLGSGQLTYSGSGNNRTDTR